MATSGAAPEAGESGTVLSSPAGSPRRVPLTYALSLGLCLALALAIVPTRGTYRADSIALLFVALGVAIALVRELVSTERGGPPRSVPERQVAWGVFVVLASFVVIRVVDSKLVSNALFSMTWLKAIVVLQGLVLATYLRDLLSGARSVAPRSAAIRFAVLGALTFVGCLETLRLIPVPPIDVWDVQTQGANALLSGQNPYDVVRVWDTAPGVISNDTPYVYPPLQLLLTIPAKLLGDVRLTMIAAVLVIGVAVRRVARAVSPDAHPLITDAPALFVWMAPKTFYVIEQAWIDPVQIAFIASACAFAFERRIALAAAVFGLSLASKQTMFWVFPLAAAHFRLRPKELAICVGTAAATAVPFALWSFGGLFHSNVGFLTGLKPRSDALTFIQWAHRVLDIDVPHRIAFVLAAIVVALVVWRRGSPHRFGMALALTYFFFFAFNRWANANYYFFTGGAAALGAAAALGVDPRSRPT